MKQQNNIKVHTLQRLRRGLFTDSGMLRATYLLVIIILAVQSRRPATSYYYLIF